MTRTYYARKLNFNVMALFCYHCVLCLVMVFVIVHLSGCDWKYTDALSGKYVHCESGTYAVFYPDGRFYYSFITNSPILDRNGWPRRMGHYRFATTTDTTPTLSLNSFDALQFSIQFSETKDQFYLTYPSRFKGVRVYEKTLEREKLPNTP